MPDKKPTQGRHKSTPRALQRVTVGKSQDWRFPPKTLQEREDEPGTLICPSCHAISLEKRWFLDEPQYERLRTQADVKAIACPGCERVERGIFEGRVLIGGEWLGEHKTEILNLVRNQETQARQTNPFSRIGAIKDHDEQIEVFVTTQWLAERIGKELRKAHKGQLQIQHLQEKFSSVYWYRD